MSKKFKIFESLLGSLVLTAILCFAGTIMMKQSDDIGENGWTGFLKNGILSDHKVQTQDENIDYSKLVAFNGIYAPIDIDIDIANAISPNNPLNEIPISIGDIVVIPTSETQVIDYKETDVKMNIPLTFFDRLTNEDAKSFIDLAGINFENDDGLSNFNYQVIRYAYKVPEESTGSLVIAPNLVGSDSVYSNGMIFIGQSYLGIRSYDTGDKWPVDDATKENMYSYTYNYFITTTPDPGQVGEGYLVFQEDKRYTNWFIKLFAYGALTADGMYVLDISQ